MELTNAAFQILKKQHNYTKYTTGTSLLIFKSCMFPQHSFNQLYNEHLFINRTDKLTRRRTSTYHLLLTINTNSIKHPFQHMKPLAQDELTIRGCLERWLGESNTHIGHGII